MALADVGIGIVIGIILYFVGRAIMNAMFPTIPLDVWKNECPHGFHPEACGICNPVE